MPLSHIEAALENLKGTGYDKYPVSPATRGAPFGYNCIAYAAGHTDAWWWPNPNKFASYWPPHLPREERDKETIENFIKAFEWKRFKKCKNGKHKKGIEKVALFVKGSLPRHAARQLPSGLWTSKCGRSEDIQHETLSAVEGAAYGEAKVFMHRRIDGKPFLTDRIVSWLLTAIMKVRNLVGLTTR